MLKVTKMTTDLVQIISNDGKCFIIETEILQQINLLKILYRISQSKSHLKVDISQNDLQLARAIVLLRMYPCQDDMRLVPSAYKSIEELSDYLCLDTEMDVDFEGHYTNDFLRLMGYEG